MIGLSNERTGRRKKPSTVRMDAVAVAVVVCDPSGVILDLNRAACNLLDLDRDEAVGASVFAATRWSAGILGESGDPVDLRDSPPAARAFAGEPVVDEVVSLVGADDGDTLCLRVSVEPLRSPAGALEKLVATLVDVSHLKATHEALRSTAAELRALVSTLPDTYLYLDADDTVVRVAGGTTTVGGPRILANAQIGAHPWQDLTGDAAGRIRQAVALTRATGKPVTAEIATMTPTGVRYDEIRHLPQDEGAALLVVRDVTESKRATEALRRSEEKYRTLYTRTPVMLHSIDAESRLLSVSDRWLDRLGYTADEVLGRRSTEFLTEESQRFAREEVLPDFFAVGQCEDVPYQMLAKDGSVVDVLLSATAERDGAGRVLRSLAVLVDVTEQRRAERDRNLAAERLAEGERAMRTLLGNIPGMAYRCRDDRDWTALVLNDGCVDLTGYSREELLGDAGISYASLIHPDDREVVWSAIHAALSDRSPWTLTYRLRTRNGDQKWVWERGVGVLDASGDLLHLEGFVTDITGLKEAEASLRDREEMLSGLVSSLPGAAYRSEIADPWRTTFMSEGCRELTGYGPDELVDGDVAWLQVVHPDDLQMVIADLHRDLAAGAPGSQSEHRIVTKNGDVRWLLDRGTFINDETGRPGEMVGLLMDVTDLHEAKEARDESERRLHSLLSNVPGWLYRSEPRPPWADEVIVGGDASLVGYTPEQLMDPEFSWEKIVHPEDGHLLEESAAESQESGRGEAEYRIRTADGRERWVWDRFALVRDAHGEPLAQEGLLLDVTDRHASEEALRRSRTELELHARIAKVFLTSPEDEMFADVLDVVREALDSRWGFFGYIDGDGFLVTPSMTRQVWEACDIPGKDLRFSLETHTDALWSRVLRTGRSEILERPGVVPEGHLPIDRALAVPILHHGATIGIYIVASREDAYEPRDLDLLESLAAYTAPVLRVWLDRHSEQRARREAEAALSESEHRYRTLVDALPVGVFGYDRDLRFTDCNPVFEAESGAAGGEYLGRSIREILTDRRPLSALEQAIAGGDGLYEGAYRSAADDRELWITLKTAPVYDVAGVVIGGTAVLVDRTEQKTAEDGVRHLLSHDAVTGFANRALLEDRTHQAIEHARRRRLAFGVATLRIDRFDTLASSLGHDTADALLAEIGHRLQRAGRAEDTLAHMGAGTYALLLPGVAGPTEAGAAVGKLVATVGDPIRIEPHELFITVSMGVAVYPADGATAEELLRNADAAMHHAADEGGDRWRFFHPAMNADRADRLALDTELHHALDDDQFFLVYQPVVDARTGSIISVEALLRWRHPQRGVVPPLDFIPMAEESGVLVPIGEWVLTEACRQGRAWQRRLGRPLRIAVNIGARQLHDESLVETVRNALRTTGFDAHSLELEITETAAMRDARHTARVLGALRAMSVRIALDDFGTGYSSLSHLVRLPISTVKIDRSFVRDLLSVPEHAAVAASVIALGHRLGLLVVAEGVETIGERSVLRDEGCDAIQGFLYSRPVTAAECEKLLETGAIER